MKKIISFLLFLGLSTNFVLAQQPDRVFVYENQIGEMQNKFLIGPEGVISGGTYILDSGEPVQFDRLTYIQDVEFDDGRDNSPARVRGWVYEGSDKSTNTWRIIFGKDENSIPGTYPIYYSFKQDGEFTRWLLTGGTTRREGTYSDEILATLWANQQDLSCLGLQPFDPQQLNPLIVDLAWRDIETDLASTLKRHDNEFKWHLVRIPSGRLKVNLQVDGNSGDIILKTLKSSQNVKIDAYQAKTTKAIQYNASDLSAAYKTDGKASIQKISEGQMNFINSHPILKDLGIIGEIESAPKGSARAITSPWQPLAQNEDICQFWRLEFGFQEKENDAFKLSMDVQIGICKTSERELGDKYIRLTLKSANYDELIFNRTLKPGNQMEMSTRSNSVIEMRSIPDGYELHRAVNDFSLRDALEKIFTDYCVFFQ